MKISHLLAAIGLAAIPAWLGAKEPDGYYDSCKGMKGAALLAALEDVVSDHTALSYSDLWNAFKTTDIDSDGTLIDMYSTVKWTPGSDQCGTYSALGDCYNREHSFPKSWFSSKTPMYTDLYHLYPTDGKVNGQRSNYPFGECENGTYIASTSRGKALGRLGTSTFSGYSGTVFEPDDQYKGDFARTYFYMAAAYNSQISTWSSEMLAGNAYPAYTTWAVNLLLKWHREDPVDEKELARNEAVSAYQHNRNPFIDHPELAEHIWGDAMSEGWSGSTSAASIILPADGSAVDMGYVSVGHSRSVTVAVRTDGATSPVTVTISGTGLSVTPATITATEANNGAYVTVTASPTAEGSISGTLTVTCGSLTSAVTIRATAIEGVGLRVAQVTAESIEVAWADAHGDGAVYSLDVMTAGVTLDGFPEAVDASDEGYIIAGLEPATLYAITLTTPDGPEGPLEVTTGAPVAVLNVIASGSLDFTAAVGAATDPVELAVETRYVDGNLAVSVGEPFEVSTDKTSWSQAMELLPDEDRFYIRAGATVAGEYTATLRVTGGGAEWESDVTLLVSDEHYFLETFEVDDDVAATAKPYQSDLTVECVAGRWTLANAGIEDKSSSHNHDGDRSMRFGKNSTSTITLADDLDHGAGTISFYAAKWSSSESTPTLHIESSTDGGSTWTDHATVTVSSPSYELFTAEVKQVGSVRFRLRQSAGGRLNVDDISVTPYGSSAISSISADGDADGNPNSGNGSNPDKGNDADPDATAWDAYCLDGRLVIEGSPAAIPLTVYTIDAATLWTGAPTAQVTLPLPPGLYIVASLTHARRVLIH